MYSLAWAAVMVPLGAFALSFLPETPRRAAQVCVAGTAATFALAMILLLYRLGHATNNPYQSVVTFWTFNPGTLVPGSFLSDFHPQVGVLVDGLSAVFLALTSLVFLLLQVHSLTSMRGDAGSRRFFATTTFLLFAVAGVVASPNLFSLYVTWELLGVAAALLVAHEWQRLEAVRAARRALVMTRPGDLSLLLGLVFLFVKLAPDAALQPIPPGQDVNDPYNFFTLANEARRVSVHQVVGAGTRTVVVLGVLLLVAALVRAAQVPFHAWFEGAVEAPGPAAALAPAGMLGLSGVFLLLRTGGVLAAAPHLLSAVALVGAGSAALTAAAALAAADIRRIALRGVLAQLGLAVAAVGAGSPGAAALLLAVTVVNGPLVVLACADIARAYRSSDLRELGGARRRMPWTAWALLAGCASGGGVVLLSGFWGRVALLRAVFAGGPTGGTHISTGVRGVTTALLLVAFLVLPVALLRLGLLTCGGEPARRRGFQPDRVRESGAFMRVPLALLAVLSVAVGFAGIDGLRWSLQRLVDPTGTVPSASAVAYLLAAVVPLAGALAAGLLYGRRVLTAASMGARFAPAAALATAMPPSGEVLDRAGGLLLPVARAVGRVDDDVAGALDAAGEGTAVLAGLEAAWERLSSPRAVAALAGAALLAGAVVLAAGGHLPGVGATR